MADQTEMSYILDGQQVRASDLNAYADGAYSISGNVLAAIIGVDNAQVDDHPLTCTVSDLVITVGGPNQAVFLERTLRDYCPATPLSFAAGGGSDRTDSIYMEPTLVNVDSFSVDFMDNSGNVTTGVGTHAVRGISLVVVPQGDTPPTGYVQWATVVVRAGAIAINPDDITILFDTVATLISIAIGSNGVTSFDGLTGAITVTAADGTIILTVTGNNIDFKVGVANLPPQTIVNYGSTGGGSVANGSIVLPNDGKSYFIEAVWNVYQENRSCSISLTSTAALTSQVNAGDFSNDQGHGCQPMAFATATGAGQTITATGSSTYNGAGTSTWGNGIWKLIAHKKS